MAKHACPLSFLCNFVLMFFLNDLAFATDKVCINRQELTAKSPGIVTKYLLTNGAKVRPGQTILEMDSRMLRAGVKEGQGALDAARANVELANDSVNRLQKVGAGEAITEQQLVESKIRLSQAKAMLKQAEGANERLMVQLEDTVIKAQLAGTLYGVPSIIGFPVQAGQSLGYIQVDTTKCKSESNKTN